MRIMVYCFTDTGLGHWYRCRTLAKIANRKGHDSFLVTDRDPEQGAYYYARENDQDKFEIGVNKLKPDWVIIDLPEKVPDWVFNIKSNVCVITGLGHRENKKADLIINQGLVGEYCAPDYIILRDEVFNHKSKLNSLTDWFVFGGAKDKLSLIKTFSEIYHNYNYSALVSPDVISDNFPFHWIMSKSKRACISFGMTAWELAVYGIPTYAFSIAEGHLNGALKMEEAGYIKAYHKTGLPKDLQSMRHFLETSYTPTGKKPDGKGAERIIKLMEDY